MGLCADPEGLFLQVGMDQSEEQEKDKPAVVDICYFRGTAPGFRPGDEQVGPSTEEHGEDGPHFPCKKILFYKPDHQVRAFKILNTTAIACFPVRGQKFRRASLCSFQKVECPIGRAF